MPVWSCSAVIIISYVIIIKKKNGGYKYTAWYIIEETGDFFLALYPFFYFHLHYRVSSSAGQMFAGSIVFFLINDSSFVLHIAGTIYTPG